MANFCKFCGKELKEGKCDCVDYLAEESKVKAEGEQVDYQQQAKGHLNNSKVLLFNFLKKPRETMSGSIMNQDKATPIILGVSQLVIIILAIIIKLGDVKFAEKFKISLSLAVLVGLIVVLTASIIFVISKKLDSKMQYKNVVAVFCLATIPTSVILVGAFLLSYIYVLGAVVALLVAWISWIVLSTEAATICMKTSKDKAFWIALAVNAVIIMLVFAFGKNMVVSYFKGIISNAIYGGFSGLF